MQKSIVLSYKTENPRQEKKLHFHLVESFFLDRLSEGQEGKVTSEKALKA